MAPRLHLCQDLAGTREWHALADLLLGLVGSLVAARPQARWLEGQQLEPDELRRGPRRADPAGHRSPGFPWQPPQPARVDGLMKVSELNE